MDEGTNALKVLKGEEYKLAHGFVGVKCRSQKDNINNKSISFALEEEKEFFRKHPIYKDISISQGIGVLANKLSKLLTSHIRKCLPKIEELIKLNLEKEIDRLKELGPAITFNTNEEAFDFVTKIIEEYSESYSHFIQGKSDGLAGFKYACCTKIHEEFRYFGDTLIKSLNPLNEINIEVLLNEIRRSQGIDPCLFLPEEACRNVIIECIKKLMNPSKICWDRVLKILERSCRNKKIISPELYSRKPLYFFLVDNMKKLLNINYKKLITVFDVVQSPCRLYKIWLLAISLKSFNRKF